MQLFFTYHALKRIEDRDIKFQEIIDCLLNPDKIKRQGEKYIFLKRIKDKALITVCTIEGKYCKIITAIKSSQVNKYL